MTDWRTELQALVNAYDAHVSAYDAHGGRWPQHHEDALMAAVEHARAALARYGHQPAPSAEGEAAELVADLKRESSAYSLLNSYRRWQLRLTRAADLLEQRHPAPVPVAERPWEREGWCDEQGRCWWGRQESGDWYADWTFSTCEDTQEFCTHSPMTVCLPANALPLPAGEVKK